MLTRILITFGLAALLGVPGPALAQRQSDGDALVEAIRNEDGNKAMDLLGSNPRLVDSRDDKGDTGLIIALRRSDPDWTGVLLRNGANVELAGRDGDTPLVLATRVGFVDAVGWLLGLGAKVDSTNKMGETALIVAVQSRNARLVRALLAAKADPDKTDYAGYSARDYAKRDNRSRQMSEIIEAAKPRG